MSVRIGTRGSPLALAQVAFVTKYFEGEGIDFSVHTFKTTGDIITDKPLYDIGGKALFSKELERALLDNEVDLVVHSLKDLETPRPEGLTLCAFLKRADPRDVLVTSFDLAKMSIHGCQLADLPKRSVVGTSSPRREVQALYHRPDLVLKNLRGNVQTRLSKIGEHFDAIFLAKAGLDRLGFTIEASAIQSIDIMVPAAGQGIITLECRTNDQKTMELVKKLNDRYAEAAALFERQYIEKLGASCRSAVGVHFDPTHKDVNVFLDATLNKGKVRFSHYFIS